MNILNELDTNLLDILGKNLGYVNLHTRQKSKAINQSIAFFASYKQIQEDYYFYTQSNEYNVFGGCCFKLEKDNKNVYFLVLQK